MKASTNRDIAGVIPALSDCTMSASRKSSASFARAPFTELPFGSDRLNWRAGNAPPFEPKPPPASLERQKDEGFAKFLKKHSSPTHNRITAGGRIVPMEPHARSPPPFTLTGDMSTRAQGHACDSSSNENVMMSRDSNVTPQFDLRRHKQISSDENGQPLQLPPEAWQTQDMMVGQSDIYYQPMSMTNAYEQQISPLSFPEGFAGPSPLRNIQAVPPFGGPIGAPMLNEPFGMTTYPGRPNMGTGIPLTDQYASSEWQQAVGPSQPLPQPMGVPMQQSPHQLLLAWEQHYADLDQQLKNIDRHRAMSSLDLNLASQRRAIVQQRSDAKDVIKEIQGMLGIRRYLDSSSESWNAGFNVEAPAYVPRSFMHVNSPMPHEPSLDVFQSSPILEKPRGTGQKRVIPIVAPADKNIHAKSDMLDSSGATMNTATNLHRWSSDESGPEVDEKSDSRALVLHESSDGSRQDSASAESTSTPDQILVVPGGKSDVGSVKIIPSRNESPRHQHEEIEVLLRAIQQPKNIVTKVRLLDGRVIDVEGQGIELSSVLPPPNSGPLTQFSTYNANTTPVKHARQGSMAGKEDYPAARRFRQKAITDAFLDQYSIVNDNMGVGIRPETQSLRTASNGQSVHNFNAASTYIPVTAQLINQENLHNTKYGTPVRVPSQHKPIEAVFEDMNLSMDEPNNKGYSMVSVQNVHAIGSLPNNFDGAVEARQSVQAQLASASKTRSPRSPRLLRRLGGNGGA